MYHTIGQISKTAADVDQADCMRALAWTELSCARCDPLTGPFSGTVTWVMRFGIFPGFHLPGNRASQKVRNNVLELKGGVSDGDDDKDKGGQEERWEVWPMQVLVSITTSRIIIALADKQCVWWRCH